MELAIETHKLSKIYPSANALVDCELNVAMGTVFGLLGPNGAGKTTLIRTLMGYIKPTRGSAKICGWDCVKQSVEARRQVAYLPGEARLYRVMRGRDCLEMFCSLHPHGSYQQSIAIAKQLDLDLSRRVMFMSTGMRQKLAISIVLGSNAPLIILDEPTANLDPTVRSEVVRLINQARQADRTIVLSSHIFSDIEDSCEHLAILRTGQLVASAELSKIRKLHIVRGVTSSDFSVELNELKQSGFVEFANLDGRNLVLHLSDDPNHWMPWLATLQLKHLQITNAGVRGLYERYHPPASAAQLSESKPFEPVKAAG
jgi:ABC-2 type transport system ATP-binding protein